MKDDSFKHAAVNKLSVICGHAWHLEKAAREDIHAELAIETRDLCQDIMHRIDMFEQRHAMKILPERQGVAV